MEKQSVENNLIEVCVLEGDCVRCHVHQPGKKVFLFTSNPSVTFGGPGPMVTEANHYIVCKTCLTDEEIARLLAPVAIFILQTLFIYVQHSTPVTPSAAHVVAALTMRSGAASVNDKRNREKALEALG